MKLIGIVAEYNPFHNGHKFHIEESKKQLSDETAIVCVMSGDFVQRGDAALFSKYARAEAAVRAGADLIIELPLPWSLSSAEGFARGAVGLLGALGCVSYLSFGSECGDLNILSALATAIMDPNLDAKVLERLGTGVSYAVARHQALAEEIGSLADYLETPNNILAVEYLKAIYSQRLRIEPFTVVRSGADHDAPGGSASDIRKLMHAGKPVKAYVPRKVIDVMKRETEQGRGPVFIEMLESALLSRFRIMEPSQFNSIPDSGEGLGNRLYAAAREETSIDGILSAAKTKRYAMSRLRRMCLCAALGIRAGDADGIPPYARILAANDTGRRAIKLISEKTSIPLVTKPATIKELPSDCKALFELESAAHDFYVLAYSAKQERRGLADWRTSPTMV